MSTKNVNNNETEHKAKHLHEHSTMQRNLFIGINTKSPVQNNNECC